MHARGRKHTSLCMLLVFLGFSYGAAASNPDALEIALRSQPLLPEVPAVTEALSADIPHWPMPRGRSAYFGLITEAADRQGLPPAIADAVVRVESAYNPAAIGGVGE